MIKFNSDRIHAAERKQQTNLPDNLKQLKVRIQYTDDKINKLVYSLYGLSGEEIGIVGIAK